MHSDFERFLDDVSRCFVERDCDLWLSRLLLPFSIITKSGPVLLPTRDAVGKNFDLYQQAIAAMQVDLIHRSAVSLEDCQDGTWLGTFQTRLLAGTKLTTAPYTSTALLHFHEGGFRMSSMLNGRGHSEWTGVFDV